MYIPPGHEGIEDGEFYLLPSNEQILKDLRACGGDIRLFLRTKIDRKYRREALIQVLERFEDDEDSLTQFLELRRLAQLGAVFEAEDQLLRSTRPGRENSTKAIELALTALDTEKWGKRRLENASKAAQTDIKQYTKELNNG